MGTIRIPLEAAGIYHIFNHAIGKDDIFREDENYFFFLRKISSRITPFADVLAYCLMLNHFHFVIRIKSHAQLVSLWKDKLEKRKRKLIADKLPVLSEYELLDAIMVAEFGSLFNSYVQSFNKKYFRQGALLKESFQRKRIDTADYLIKVICYVHNNPVDHGFTVKPEDWKYSSFNAILSGRKTDVLRDEVLEMFSGRENFIFVHEKNRGLEI